MSYNGKMKGGRTLILFAKYSNRAKTKIHGKISAQKWPGFFLCLFDFQIISLVENVNKHSLFIVILKMMKIDNFSVTR